MKITFISDTHSKHNQINHQLIGGDLLIHAGDISSRGWNHEIENFCKWFSKVPNYTHKIFIAGNHDWGFQNNKDKVKEILDKYPDITYLEDEFIIIDGVKIYGTPWQPWFLDWAFNLPRNGEELQSKWDKIPEDTDILITHCPSFGYLDKVIGTNKNLGCELLVEKVKEIKPKIHVSGHIHTGNGYVYVDNTHMINASILNEEYVYNYKPFTMEWNSDNNEVSFDD